MSTRNSSAGRNRFFDCFCVFAVTVISISALFFIGCKQRFFFILPGMGFFNVCDGCRCTSLPVVLRTCE